MGKRTTRNNPQVGTANVRPHRTMVGKKPHIALFCLLLLASVAAGQTFELGNQNSTTPSNSGKKKPKAQTSSPQPSAHTSDGSIGWGSGIVVARDSRAPLQALQRNDYS